MSFNPVRNTTGVDPSNFKVVFLRKLEESLLYAYVQLSREKTPVASLWKLQKRIMPEILRRSRKLKIRNEGDLQFGLSRRIWVRKCSSEHKRELKRLSNLQEPKYSAAHQIVVERDESGRSNFKIHASSDPNSDFVN